SGLLLIKAKTVNGEVQIQALVDGKKVIVTEMSVRRALQLKDVEGTECLPNATIFEQMTLMGAKTTAWNEFSSTMASAVISPEELGEGSEILTDPQHIPTIIQPSTSQPQKKQPRRKQRKDTEVSQPSGSTEPITDEAANEEHVPIHSNDLLISEIAKLKERVKKLKRRNKSRTPWLKRLRKVGRTARIESSKDEGLGAQVTLVDEAQGRNDENLMFNTGVFDEQKVEVEKVVSTTEVTTTITIDELTLAQTLIEIKAPKPKVVTTAAITTTTAVTRPKDKGVVVQEPSEFTTTTSQPSQLPHAKDKGKGKMVEPEKPLKKKDQILIDEEIAQRL
ncbi:hypothetical protein Tco_0684861, partial [Tanacetum coccineum]